MPKPKSVARSTHLAPAEEESIDTGMLPDLIGYHVRLAQMAIFSDFEIALADLELSPGLFALLVLIEANPGMKQTHLAEAARLDRSTLVPALDKLEDRGWVERRAAPLDRRSNGLFITASGTTILSNAKRAVRRHEARLARDLSVQDREQLITLLGRVLPERR